MSARDEILALRRLVPTWQTVALPTSGALTLRFDESLTFAHLRRVAIDANPPIVAQPSPPYDSDQGDGYIPGTAPYAVPALRPFGMRLFRNEWSVQGYHTAPMADYARGHGFSVIAPYSRQPSQMTHYPAGTGWLHWLIPFNWSTWLAQNGGGSDRFDVLHGTTLEQAENAVAAQTALAYRQGYTRLMLDIEHPVYSLATLRAQPFYPAGADEQTRLAFEENYYRGYAATFSTPVNVARRNGWEDISVYGWQPFARTYWGLESANPNPATDWAWGAHGQYIYDALDTVNVSLYAFYPRRIGNTSAAPGNPTVAYALANLDLNMRFVNAQVTRKPVLPYVWHRYHYSGGGWFGGQAIDVDDVTALTAMLFTSGISGIVQWDWTGTSNQTISPPLDPGTWTRVSKPFIASRNGAPAVVPEGSYIYIWSDANEQQVAFSIGDNSFVEPYGITASAPVYRAPRMLVRAYTRPLATALSGVFMGLAVVRVLEYCLYYGTPALDVSAQAQFDTVEPVVRRVVCAPYHVVMSYDPAWAAYTMNTRTVNISVDGTTVTVPADRQLRVWVLAEE